jgi:hypothetical protein
MSGDIDSESQRHEHRVGRREAAQRPRDPRVCGGEAAGADAPVPGGHRHDHEQCDLRGQQQVVRRQARVPGVHVRQPVGRDHQGFELADDPRRE